MKKIHREVKKKEKEKELTSHGGIPEEGQEESEKRGKGLSVERKGKTRT